MNLHEEIYRARTEATNAKREGRDTRPAKDRLRELYKIPRRKSKKARITIA